MQNRERWTKEKIKELVDSNNEDASLRGWRLAAREDYPCNTCRDLQDCDVAFDPYNMNVPIEDCLGNK